MLRGAIVGFGKIAQTGHVPAYLDTALSGIAKIVAVAEPNRDYRERATEFFPCVKLFDSLESLVESERVDFVDICTPPSMHGEGIRICIERGIHIICEKPFTSNLAEATELAEMLRVNRDVVFLPCHQYRFSPLWVQFREAIEFWKSQSRFLLQFNVYRLQPDPGYLAANPNWRVDRSMSGGGILADTGVHYLYLILWMLGRPKDVSAVLSKLHHNNLEVEDTALVSIECERGVAQMALTWAARERANSARLSCAAGSLVYDGSSLVKTSSNGRANLPVPDASDKRSYVQQYVALIKQFCEQVNSGVREDVWIEEAFQTIKLLHACYRFSRSNQQISSIESFDAPALNSN